MLWLITEILGYLIVAAVLGLILGYLIWGWRRSGASEHSDAALRVQMLEAELAESRAEQERAAQRLATPAPDLTGEIDTLRTERDAAQAAQEALRVDLDASRAEGVDLGAKLDTALAEKTSLQDQVNAGGPDLDQLRADLDACVQARTQLDAQLEAGATERADLQAQLDACRAAAAPKTPAPVPTEVPRSLLTERPAEIDDLKVIKGVGPVMEGVLNDKGIYLYRQVANLSAAEVAWVNEAIDAFPGRIERDEWVRQAQGLYREKYGRRHDED